MIEADAQAQGRRYASEARLVVDLVNGDTIHATCRGDGAVFLLGHDLSAQWWCECGDAPTCAHLAALRLVTACRPAPVPPSGADSPVRLCADCHRPLPPKLVAASLAACWPPCTPQPQGCRPAEWILSPLTVGIGAAHVGALRSGR